MIITPVTVPVERFETEDGALFETEDSAILYEIDKGISQDPNYYHVNRNGFLDIQSKEDMLHFIRNNHEIVYYILENDPTN